MNPRLDIGYDEDQASFAAAIAAFCARHEGAWHEHGEVVAIPAGLWAGLGELGVLGLAAPDSGAEPLDVVAAHEALGRSGCPGPLWQTALIASVADGHERAAVGAGEVLATAGTPAMMPWAAQAGLVFDAGDLAPGGGPLWRCASVEIVREMVLLGREPAAQIRCVRQGFVTVSGAGIGLAELALASYLTGAARRVLDEAVGYVRARRQFRRTLSEFQSVAHPLAVCHARVCAASSLVRRTASRAAGGRSPAPDSGIAVGSAARAARETVYQAHQAYGGIGFTAEGPLAWLGARIGQLSTEAEALWRMRPVTALLASGAAS